MREYSTPPVTAAPTTGNLTDDVVERATTNPAAVSFSVRHGLDWVDLTAADFARRCRDLAQGFVSAGVEPGDRIAVMASTRFEWTLVDYAVWFAGAVSVPVYPSATTEQIRHVLVDSGVAWAVVETPGGAATLEEASAAPGVALSRVWTIDAGDLDVLSSAAPEAGDDVVEGRRTALTPASPATILYTSGTTGTPKGCVLTHGNLTAALDAALSELAPLFEEEDAATLLFLPLPHIFARIVQIGAVRAGVRLGHCGRVGGLLDDLGSFRPTFVLAVPRVFEQIYNIASQRAAADGRARAFARATDTAIAWSRGKDHRLGAGLRARHRLSDRRVYSGLRDLLGGRCRYAISGGAPLGERLGHFYRGIGLTVLEGYGLTETAGAVTVNTPQMSKLGTVGRPVPGVTVRVADDGELMVRGAQVMHGYWDAASGAARRRNADEWLATGDLAEVDDEGFVTVTGRKQEIIVTAGGKTLSPNVLEDRIRAHPLVSQCMVLGDRRPFVAALVTLDPEAWPEWARKHGLSPALRRHVDHPRVRGEIDRAVAEANAAVSQAESIRRFVVLPVDFTEESGHLTPSLKLRRGTVSRDFRAAIEALYSR